MADAEPSDADGTIGGGSQALTDGANIAWDASLGTFATVTLAGNRTLSNPTNLVAGREYILIVTQDGTGGRTLAFGTTFGHSVPIRLTAGAVSVLVWRYDGTKLRPVSWPDTVVVPVYIGTVASTTATTQFVNQPAAYTTTTAFRLVDLTQCVEFRIFGRTSAGGGVAGSKVGLEYSTDFGSNYGGHLDGVAAGSFGATGAYIPLETTGTYTSAGVGSGSNAGWLPLTANARAALLLRVVHGGGNGSASPALASLTLECR